MKFKCFFLFLVTFTLAVGVNAQVTIGKQEAPDPNALLDLKENVATTKGVMPPRVVLTSTSSTSPMTSPVTEGMTVYNTATQGDVRPGYYYYYSGKWVRLETDAIKPKFFYMPSIVLPLDNTDPAYSAGTFTINLYDEYKKQFDSATLPNIFPVNSPGAPSTLPIYNAQELYYYITYYDTAVFNTVSVDIYGVLRYTLVSRPSITEKSYMNIVFVVK